MENVYVGSGFFNEATTYGNDLITTLDSLQFIKSHVKRFGVNEVLLDLCDKNKELTTIFKLEDDNDPNRHESNIVKHILYIKQKIEKFWQLIKKNLKEFFQRWFTTLGWLERKIKNIHMSNFGSKGRYINVGEFDKKEIKALKFSKFKEIWNACIIGLHELEKMVPDKNYGFELAKNDRIVNNLKVIGYNLTSSDKTGIIKIEAGNKITFEELTVKNGGWTVGNISTYLDLTSQRIQSLRKIEYLITALEKFKNDIKDDNFKVSYQLFINQTNSMINALTYFSRVFEKMLWMLAKIASKAPMNKD